MKRSPTRTTSGLVLLAAALAASAPASDYAEIRERIGEHPPPPLFRAYLEPPPEDSPPALPEGAELRLQAEQLSELADAWRAALDLTGREGRFLRPDPARLALLGAAAGDAAAAAALVAEELQLEDLEALALLRNPFAMAAESTFRATLEAYSQVNDLDTILRRYSAFTEGVMTGLGGMSEAPPTTRFPFPGVLALKGEVAGQEVAVARERLEEARGVAVTEVRTAFWELTYLERALEVSARTLDLFQDLGDAAAKRYQAGDASFQDVVRVRAEVEKIREQLTTLDEERSTLATRLRAALELPADAPVGAPVPPETATEVPPHAVLGRLALERRQALRARRAEVAKMERMIEMAETMIYPAYTLNLSLFPDRAITQVGTMPMEEPFPTTVPASEGAGLPKMPWLGTNDAYLRETRQRLEAARRELRGAEAEAAFQVREVWFRLDRARREADLYRTQVIGLSQLALEAAAQGYQAGTVSFADVIKSYQEWFEAMLLAERKGADLGIARAELEQVVGVSPLPR